LYAVAPQTGNVRNGSRIGPEPASNVSPLYRPYRKCRSRRADVGSVPEAEWEFRAQAGLSPAERKGRRVAEFIYDRGLLAYRPLNARGVAWRNSFTIVVGNRFRYFASTLDE